MDDFDQSTITQWIQGIKTGEDHAAQQLWNRYFQQILTFARGKLQQTPTGAADEEDVAASVFESLCRGAEAGRFDDVRSRDELWWLLLAITQRKCASQIRRELAQKRGAGRVQDEQSLGKAGDARNALAQLISREPTPEFLISLEEQWTHLLQRLRDDLLRKIAVYRVEGYSNKEICAKLSISASSVTRKLRLIRSVWTQELEL